MKQKHTSAKKANRCSAFAKFRDERASLARRNKRESMQPKERKCYGRMVRRIQTIKLEKYNGVRRTVTINIEHAAVRPSR